MKITLAEALMDADEEIQNMLIDAAIVLGTTHVEYDETSSGYFCYDHEIMVGKIVIDPMGGWMLSFVPDDTAA